MDIIERLTEEFDSLTTQHGEYILTIAKADITNVAQKLHSSYGFNMLIDLCGVDYRAYGHSNWSTSSAAYTRARASQEISPAQDQQDFAVVYHLLSVTYNQRLRVRCYLSEDDLVIDSVRDIWNCADWYEREAFDMFGILFANHPDLRRILTDYGFIGHPLRKDFPTVGEVEMRYDEKLERVVYEPVSITMQENVPRVIRE